MSNCCSTNGTSQTIPPTVMIGTCPRCGTRGKKVDLETVKAMLSVSLRALEPLTQYNFCRTAECEVVYFASEARRVRFPPKEAKPRNGTLPLKELFTTDEVRVPVHQKHPHSKDVPVCYCFTHTPGSIRAEWLAIAISTVVADITSGIKAGQCACEIRNPQGSCCLGNVRKVVMREQPDA